MIVIIIPLFSISRSPAVDGVVGILDDVVIGVGVVASDEDVDIEEVDSVVIVEFIGSADVNVDSLVGVGGSRIRNKDQFSLKYHLHLHPSQQAHRCLKRNVYKFNDVSPKASKYSAPVPAHSNITRTIFILY